MREVAQKGGRTVLFVSHNMGAIRSLCQTGVLLSSGSVLASGLVDNLVDAYLRQPLGSQAFKPNMQAVSYIVDCELRQASGAETAVFFTNEEVQIVMRYFNRRRINGLRCGFRVSAADGTVLACFTPEDEGVVSPKDEGLFEVRAIITKNTLLKGAYQISLAVWNGSTGEIYDDVQGIAEFTMEAARERAYLSEFTRPGLFQAAAKWYV
jgi:lipopolysaccharide transport system ATP-binding protein